MSAAVVTLDPLTTDDARRCAELEAELFAGDDPWSARAFRAAVRDRDTHYLAAREGDVLVGYAGLALLGPRAHPESEVHTIAVDPAWHGRRVGARLLDALLAVADARGGPVFLEVRTDNDAALGLYRSRGFAVVGVRRGYYRPSGADAYTMSRPAPGEVAR
ncbi:ribosomal protein S18-alanine N-acetyltransferase [Rhodococcus aerolatus]